MRRPRARALAVALSLVLSAVACREGGTPDAAYDEYFHLMTAEMQAFDDQIGVIVASQAELERDALGASQGVYALELEKRASALEAISAPGEAADPHRRFVTAFKYLAEAKQLQSTDLLGTPTGLTSDALAARVDSRSSEWFELCHELQDLALVREIDADLRCSTALHRRG